MISLIHPSRGRPTKAFYTAKKWIDSAGVQVEHILSLDFSDATYPQYEGGNVIVNNNTSVVEATNKAAAVSKGDILVYLSDDFDCFDNWGEAVEKEFEDRPLLIKVNDGLQAKGVPVLTIPIMNRLLYDKLGYFWHPSYKSMFVDEDLYWTSKRMGALKMAEHLTFQHNHVSIGKAEDDETYRRSSANWNQGKETFRQRKAANFL